MKNKKIKKQTTNKNLDFESLFSSGVISQGEHTKTKEPFKILRLDNKLSKEEFKSFNDWLKSTYSGYWSRFVGGFILPNDFNINKLMSSLLMCGLHIVKS
jgi:Txe/YoeB family toxin of Txe-Axe toxin-antitoxin module